MESHVAVPCRAPQLFIPLLVVSACDAERAHAETPDDRASPTGKGDSFAEDDRTSVVESRDPRAPIWAESVALLTSRLSPEGFAVVPTLEERFDLCPGEPFAEDPFLGHCSAFLVGPQTLATAGHCLDQHPCEHTWVLFGYNDAEGNDDVLALDTEHLYRCSDTTRAGGDVALLHLDRVVSERPVLELGVAYEGTRVAMVGHPLGGRATVDLSGMLETVRDFRIESTLDTFSGHSGSPILDLDSGHVVAVHTHGAGLSIAPDPVDGCSRLASCQPDAFQDCLARGTTADQLPLP